MFYTRPIILISTSQLVSITTLLANINLRKIIFIMSLHRKWNTTPLCFLITASQNRTFHDRCSSYLLKENYYFITEYYYSYGLFVIPNMRVIRFLKLIIILGFLSDARNGETDYIL